MKANSMTSIARSHPRIETSHPRKSRMALAIMVAGLAALIAWAAFSKIDQVTRAPARVIAAERSQVNRT